MENLRADMHFPRVLQITVNTTVWSMLLSAFFPRSECPQDGWKAAVCLCAAQNPPRLPCPAHLKFVLTILAKASVPQAMCLLQKALLWVSLVRGACPALLRRVLEGSQPDVQHLGTWEHRFCCGRGGKKKAPIHDHTQMPLAGLRDGPGVVATSQAASCSLALREKQTYGVTEHTTCAYHFVVEVIWQNLHVDQ